DGGIPRPPGRGKPPAGGAGIRMRGGFDSSSVQYPARLNGHCNSSGGDLALWRTDCPIPTSVAILPGNTSKFSQLIRSPQWGYMSCSHNIRKALIFSAAFCLGSTVMANECGEPPAAPPLVDGATATMEAVVANSDEVKVYIADADKYLDCREAAIATEGFTALD